MPNRLMPLTTPTSTDTSRVGQTRHNPGRGLKAIAVLVGGCGILFLGVNI
jgi:hypothetical protein